MSTVLYFEMARNKKKIVQHILTGVIGFTVLFLITLLLDRFVPVVNEQYMKWPDMLKDLLGLPAWKRSLYGNIWQILMLFYPFYVVYRGMAGLSCSIIQEERLETIVFLKNLSISRGTIMFAKWIVHIADAFINIVVIMGLNVLFLFLLQGSQMLVSVVQYYVGLFLVVAWYSLIALFLASYRRKEGACTDAILGILILPFIISRIPALVRFFAAVLEATGRTGEILEKLGSIADKLSVLTMVSPLTWCWTEIRLSGEYILCAVLIGLVMVVTAFCIYTGKQSVYED